MAEKTIIPLPLSEKATGITKLETKTVTKDGIQEKCINHVLKIIPERNVLEIEYQKVYLNNKDELLEVKPINKRIFVVDKGEVGEAELNPDGTVNMDTYVKIKDEALNVTDWDKLLGATILGSLKNFIEYSEGYITKEEYDALQPV